MTDKNEKPAEPVDAEIEVNTEEPATEQVEGEVPNGGGR